VSDKFTEYYSTMHGVTLGMQIEGIFLDILRNHLKKGHQIFNDKQLWLSATPDAFTINDNIPVEIKTKNKGTLLEVIRSHYHQLQMTMYCANSPVLLLIIYILTDKFYVVKLYKDKNFIIECLHRLEKVFLTHITNISTNTHELTINRNRATIEPNNCDEKAQKLRRQNIIKK